jgi:hypothetical protein
MVGGSMVISNLFVAVVFLGLVIFVVTVWVRSEYGKTSG